MIKINVESDTVEDLLNKMHERIEEPEGADAALQTVWAESRKMIWESSGDTEDTNWQDYSQEPKWEAIRTSVLGSQFATTQILRWPDTPIQELEESASDPSNPNFVFERDGNDWEVGTSHSIADQIREGGTNPKTDEQYPGRDFLATGRRTENRIADMFEDFIAYGE